MGADNAKPISRRPKKKKTAGVSRSSTGTVSRQWLTMQLIPPIGGIGAPDIHRALQEKGVTIDVRTVQRDLQALSQIFPIESYGPKTQLSWRWKTDAEVTHFPMMSDAQALAFFMADKTLDKLLPLSILKELRPWFDSAYQQIQTKASVAHRWADKIRFAPPAQPLIPPTIPDGVLNAVQEALLLDRRIDATYKSRSKNESLDLELDPLAIVQRGGVMYLIATGRSLATGNSTDEIRRYAMHRFSEVKVRDEKVKRPSGFDLDDYLHKGGMGFGNGKMRKLKAVFPRETGEHLYESRLSEDQNIRELPDGRLEVKATVADTPQLEWWLRAMEAEEK